MFPSLLRHSSSIAASLKNMGYKKEWNFAMCSNMNGLGGYDAKWNNADREGHILWYHLNMEPKKHNKVVNITKRKKQTHGYREQSSGSQWVSRTSSIMLYGNLVEKQILGKANSQTLNSDSLSQELWRSISTICIILIPIVWKSPNYSNRVFSNLGTPRSTKEALF